MDRTNVIGEKVKSLRTAKEISLEELADPYRTCRRTNHTYRGKY